MGDTTEKSHGEFQEKFDDGETIDSTNFKKPSKGMNQKEEEGVTLVDIFNRFVSAIFSSDSNNNGQLIQRIKGCVSENVPLLHQASKNTAHNVYNWTRKGSPLRALLVVSVGYGYVKDSVFVSKFGVGLTLIGLFG
ncbi:hypothetical protein AABB24_037869 [Solanum stoloniferum]|uniref:Uncharacterized protein n=1 Tax=Solanum stoloniferum TaxID=62892 RepID=A0ABD2QV75_9SOLN